MAQISFGFNGGFCPANLPLFHGTLTGALIADFSTDSMKLMKRPGWYPDQDLYLDGPGIVFGAGFDLGYFGGYGWGWRHWRPDWHHRAVWFDGGQYVWHNRSLIDANYFFHGNEGFNPRHGAYGMRGMYGAAHTYLPAVSPRQFVGSHTAPGIGLSRFGGIGPEGFGRGEFGSGRPGFGAMGHAGVGHASAGAHGGSGRG